MAKSLKGDLYHAAAAGKCVGLRHPEVIHRGAPYCDIVYDVISFLMRCVLDTNVLVTAMRSPGGASAALLVGARRGAITMLANVALALEYEAACQRAEHRLAAQLDTQQVDVFIDAVLAMIEPVETHYLWRPQLRDPSDEFVLEAAANGQAAAIVTFNKRDFGVAPSTFGIELLNPAELLRRLKR